MVILTTWPTVIWSLSTGKNYFMLQLEYSKFEWYSEITVHVLRLSSSVFDWGFKFYKASFILDGIVYNAALIKIDD